MRGWVRVCASQLLYFVFSDLPLQAIVRYATAQVTMKMSTDRMNTGRYEHQHKHDNNAVLTMHNNKKNDGTKHSLDGTTLTVLASSQESLGLQASVEGINSTS